MARRVSLLRNFALLGLMGATLAFLLSLTGSVPKVVQAEGQGPIVGPRVRPGRFDGDVRTLPPVPPGRPGEPVREVPRGILPGTPPPPPARGAGAVDGAYAAGGASGLMVTPVEFTTAKPNFPGIGFTTTTPPDTVGDVGPNYYIQAVNAQFQIFDKQGNALLLDPMGNPAPRLINDLWVKQNAGNLCRNNNNGDPYVNYDHLADRWVLSQFAVPNGTTNPPTAQCIAVSQTANPVTGGWWLYEFPFNFNHDYPKIGVWPDGYYMSSQRGFSSGQLNLVAFDRANMLNGNPATFQAFTSAAPALTWLPSDLDGPPPPSGTPNFFSRHVDGDQWGGSDRVEIMAVSINWADPTLSTCGVGGAPPACGTPNFTLPAAAFDANLCAAGSLGDPCVPQPGAGSPLLDTLPHWPMGPLQYRNFGSYETLVFNHTVDVDGNGHAGVRWYELHRPSGGAWSIFQQGTYSPDDGNPGLADDVHHWMGSVAMDKAGNIALGDSVSSGTVNPSIRYTGRLTSDPLGLLPQVEATLAKGTGPVVLYDLMGNLLTRWGDYSAMRVDPMDGCTFWYTTEYGLANNTWATQIGAFRFPSCNPADLAITKSASPDPAIAGEELFYTITVRNNGPDTATNVVVTDILPAGVTYVTDTDSCAQTPPPPGELTCSLGTILPGASKSFTIKVAIPPDFVATTGPRSITNTASVTSDQLDPDLTNNTATAVTIVEDRADLKLTKECKPDGTVPAGQPFTCTLLVENLGPSSARQVRLRDEILSSLASFSSGDVTITTDPSRADSCSFVSPSPDVTIECSLTNPLEPKDTTGGGRWVIQYTIQVNEPQDINNCAQVFTPPGGTPDPNAANNQACDGVRVTGVADLALTKTDTPDPLDAGTTLTYILDVTNNGPSNAVNVLVEDFLPSGVSIVSVSGTGGAACAFGVPGDSSRPTTCKFDSLAPSANATMRIVVTVNIPGILKVAHNDARVSSDVFDPNNANNVASQDTTIRVADLRILKTSDADVYKPSSTIKYTVSVSNDGPADAANVVVTDNLPDIKQAVLQLVDPNICTQSGLTLTCALGTIPAGASKSFNIYVTIKGSQGQVSNTASVASSTFDPNAANNSSTRVVLIKGGVKVSMAVVGSDGKLVGAVREVRENDILVDRPGQLPDASVPWTAIFDVTDRLVVLKIPANAVGK